MKFKKVNLQFNDLMRMNVEIKKGNLEQVTINEEIAQFMHDKVLATTRTKKSVSITSVEGIIKNQKCTMNYSINKGWTIIKVDGVIMGDTVIITKTNEDTNEKSQQFYKIIR
ncbi:MAG: hypothetical protein RSE41_09855 [Clostridia bacterium]|uniref:hypothetical protein n=1 Tax=Clostridium sp. TaxID=1506 RepID=UPI002FCB35CC